MAEKKKIQTKMAALDPYLVDNRVLPVENEIRNQNWISWGVNNDYPQYLYSLFMDVPTLHSIIMGCLDYIKGDEVISNTPLLSQKKAEDLVDAIGFDLLVYGGTSLNIVRDKSGNPSRFYSLDFRNVRSDKKNEILYYSEDFGNKSYGRGKYIAYPSFDINERNIPSSIFYFKNVRHQTYPVSLFGAAVSDCEMERKITEFHLNSLNNNFTGSVMVNFNNGLPDDEQKEEIVENLEEKFCGVENAARIVVSFNEDKEHQATIEKIDTEDFSDRYEALVKRTRQNIFTAFRANPNLFGISTENIGFSTEEYESSYKLFSKTVIQPLQKKICDIIDTVTGVQGSIEIKPFTIVFDTQKSDNNVVIS